MAITRPLLRWYRRVARDLPWRHTDDPYAIWISEIMLQQTQVATVIDYYNRFMQRFPTVEKLARARLDGQLPSTKEELLTLPGIGQYTAGAIASIAFGRREPVVDGNVARVLCRVFCIQEDSRDTAVQKRIWSIAQDLLPKSNVGDYNQALMELGSEICVPGTPRCSDCPLARACLAHRRGLETTLPVRSPKKSIPFYTIVVGVIYKDGRILIDRRKPEGLLGGLWEFPGGKQEPDESLEEALHREIREEVGLTISVDNPLGTIDHAYSHFRIRMHAFQCTWVSGEPTCHGCTAVKWVRPAELSKYAFPAANGKIIRILQSPE